MNRTRTVAASPYAWRPIFEDKPELAKVAGDVRTAAEQETEYARVAHDLGAGATEIPGIVEALQLCERVHGHAVVTAVLPFVRAVLAAAMRGLGVPLRTLGAHQGCTTSGVFVGALVEDALGLAAEARKFKRIEAERTGSPHLEFADVMAGCALAAALRATGPHDVDRLLAFAELIRAIRFACGADAVDELNGQARQRLAHLPEGDARDAAFVAAIGPALARRGVRAPMTWLRYAQVTAIAVGRTTGDD